MIDGLKSRFITWYFNEFHNDPLFKRLYDTVEGSPWHRERNVAVHTDMVVTEFVGEMCSIWSVQDVLGALVCAFHDVGKPDAMKVKHSEARGEYRSFGGHEIISARLWEDWAARNFERLVTLFGNNTFYATDIYDVAWMIEHHLPFELRQPAKLDALARTAKIRLDSPSVFSDVLRSDAYGRISDDRADKLARVEDWCRRCDERIADAPSIIQKREKGQPHLVLPIAPSGAGKSTLFTNNLNLITGGENFTHYSWDEIRMRLYLSETERQIVAPHLYALAYQRSVEDKQFGNKCSKEFAQLTKAKKNIFVDNTNLSRKRRRPFIREARRHGYYVTAVLLPCSLDTVLERQNARLDKNVPEHAVRHHYMSLQVPLIGEVDDVRVLSSNLP